jgi:hypothetical protein
MSSRSFINFHQEFGRLVHDGKLEISRVVSNVNVKAQAMHMDSKGFKKPQHLDHEHL